MAEEGADFCQLFQFFLTHGHDESAAYDCARRVCRGGLVEGGAPFTKDVCYLDGLLRVTNFLRVALVKGHLDYVPLFFAGKIEVEDVPLFGRLMREGMASPPDYLPDWARDLSYLTAFMSFSAFLGECDLVAGAPPLRRPDFARRRRNALMSAPGGRTAGRVGRGAPRELPSAGARAGGRRGRAAARQADAPAPPWPGRPTAPGVSAGVALVGAGHIGGAQEIEQEAGGRVHQRGEPDDAPGGPRLAVYANRIASARS